MQAAAAPPRLSNPTPSPRPPPTRGTMARLWSGIVSNASVAEHEVGGCDANDVNVCAHMSARSGVAARGLVISHCCQGAAQSLVLKGGRFFFSFFDHLLFFRKGF